MLLSFWKTFLVIFLAEMGDKSQIFMVAMAAEYRLRQIFFGVGSAILLLNLLAISLGGILGNLLPMTLISFLAGFAFLFFSLSGLREEKEEAGKKKTKGAFLAIFGTYFLAELGDKTQLSTLTLAAAEGNFRFSSALGVFLGASVGLFLADILGLLVGFLLGKRLPTGIFRWISYGIFMLCGAVRLLDGFGRIFSGTPKGKILSGLLTSGIVILFLIFTGILLGRRCRDDAKRRESVSLFGQ